MDVSRCAGILSNVSPQTGWIPSQLLFPCPRLVPDLHSPPVANLFDQELSMNRRVWILFVALGLSTFFTVRGAFSQGEAQSKRRAINLPDKPVQAPFSNAILAGDTLYLAGNIGLDPKTGKAPEKIEDEIKLLLDGYKTTLAAGGMTMDDLVYVQVYCTDLAYYDKFNAAYRTYFSKDFPARAFIGAGSLLRGGHFEMQAIAVRH
jgi:2-iminobutanoate/2-iminopropanoate deaminase